jgi:hypothetical protein
MPRPLPQLAGQRFNKLLVSGSTTVVSGVTHFVCVCDCGTETLATPASLLNGHKKSCGCLRVDACLSRSTHGAAKGGVLTPEYRSWQSMINRCENTRDRAWPSYGGRGIKVCPEWRESFEVFLQHMGTRPGPRHSIERSNNDGNYEPSNCCWATKKTQARNRRSTKTVEFRGKHMSLAAACEEAGVNYDAAKYRVNVGKPFNIEIRAKR